MDLIYTVIDFISGSPHVWVFLILYLCGIGLPIPEEVTLIAAAWITRGQDPYFMFGIALLGILAGDLSNYMIGRTFGYRLVRLPYFRRILSEERLRKVDHFFINYGNWTVFIGRFFAGFRFACYFIAGISRMKVHVFLLMDFLGAILSAGITFWLIRRFGEHIEQAVAYVRRAHYLVILAALLFIAVLVGWVLWRRRRRGDGASSAPPAEPAAGAAPGTSEDTHSPRRG
jgi:membrane protein DedA with SNARE-associated domain